MSSGTNTQMTKAAPQAALAGIDPYLPQNFDQAVKFCERMVRSGFLPKAINTGEKALAVMLCGHDYGLTPWQSFRSLHVIEGKVEMSAAMIVGQCLKSGWCTYFTCIEDKPDRVTYETRRKGSPKAERWTYSTDDAKAAGLIGKDNWRKYKRNMLHWRAMAALARGVYPDVVGGVYAAGEISGNIPDGTVIDATFEESEAPVSEPASSSSAEAAPEDLTADEATERAAFAVNDAAAAELLATVLAEVKAATTFEELTAAARRSKGRLTNGRLAAVVDAYNARKTELDAAKASQSPIAPWDETPPAKAPQLTTDEAMERAAAMARDNEAAAAAKPGGGGGGWQRDAKGNLVREPGSEG